FFSPKQNRPAAMRDGQFPSPIVDSERMTTHTPTASKAIMSRLPLNWLGVAPFALFVTLFLFLPTMNIVIGAFQNPAGEFTLANIQGLNTPSIISAYWISIKISLASAILGCLIGFSVAAAVTLG